MTMGNGTYSSATPSNNFTSGRSMEKAESNIEHIVVKWATAHDIPMFKLKLDTNAGWPDRLFLLPRGVPAFIEFKRPQKKARKLQQHRIQTLQRLGYHADVFDDAEAAIRWLVKIQTSPISKASH
jgi:hypothetical protein